MHIDLEQSDIEAIASKVVELVKPLLLNNKQEADIIFDKRELAEYLKVSVSTVNALVSNAQIPYFKIAQGQSGAVRFRKRDIDKWIAMQSIPACNPLKNNTVKTLTLANP